MEAQAVRPSFIYRTKDWVDEKWEKISLKIDQSPDAQNIQFIAISTFKAIAMNYAMRLYPVAMGTAGMAGIAVSWLILTRMKTNLTNLHLGLYEGRLDFNEVSKCHEHFQRAAPIAINLSLLGVVNVIHWFSLIGKSKDLELFDNTIRPLICLAVTTVVTFWRSWKLQKLAKQLILGQRQQYERQSFDQIYPGKTKEEIAAEWNVEKSCALQRRLYLKKRKQWLEEACYTLLKKGIDSSDFIFFPVAANLAVLEELKNSYTTSIRLPSLEKHLKAIAQAKHIIFEGLTEKEKAEKTEKGEPIFEPLSATQIPLLPHLLDTDKDVPAGTDENVKNAVLLIRNIAYDLNNASADILQKSYSSAYTKFCLRKFHFKDLLQEQKDTFDLYKQHLFYKVP